MARHPVTLREALPGDAPFLADLWSGVVRPGSEAERTADLTRVIERAATSPDQRLVVAVLGDEPAGAVLLRVTTVSPLDSEPAVHAHSPHVSAGCRRRGVGRALIAAAATFAEERGVERVMTASVASSREANRFLARLGLGPLATVRTAPAAVIRARTGGAAVRLAGATSAAPAPAQAPGAAAGLRGGGSRRSRTAREVVAVRRAGRAERSGRAG